MRTFGKIVLLNFLLAIVGCNTMRAIFDNNGEGKPIGNMKQAVPYRESSIAFSENPNIGVFNAKKYKRSTRKSIEEDSDLGSQAGSLWNGEGNSSYFFTQNKTRREGELLNVKLEGAARTQIETKVGVIKKLLARLDIPVPATTNAPTPDRSLATTSASAAAVAPIAAGGAPLVPGNGANPAVKEEEPLPLDTVATRVVERLPDGNYRVRGAQSFMIGKREFKVNILGLVRPEDFSDEGIGTNKMIDPSFDVVSSKRGTM